MKGVNFSYIYDYNYNCNQDKFQQLQNYYAGITYSNGVLTYTFPADQAISLECLLKLYSERIIKLKAGQALLILLTLLEEIIKLKQLSEIDFKRTWVVFINGAQLCEVYQEQLQYIIVFSNIHENPTQTLFELLKQNIAGKFLDATLKAQCQRPPNSRGKKTQYEGYICEIFYNQIDKVFQLQDCQQMLNFIYDYKIKYLEVNMQKLKPEYVTIVDKIDPPKKSYKKLVEEINLTYNQKYSYITIIDHRMKQYQAENCVVTLGLRQITELYSVVGSIGKEYNTLFDKFKFSQIIINQQQKVERVIYQYLISEEFFNYPYKSQIPHQIPYIYNTIPHQLLRVNQEKLTYEQMEQTIAIFITYTETLTNVKTQKTPEESYLKYLQQQTFNQSFQQCLLEQMKTIINTIEDSCVVKQIRNDLTQIPFQVYQDVWYSICDNASKNPIRLDQKQDPLQYIHSIIRQINKQFVEEQYPTHNLISAIQQIFQQNDIYQLSREFKQQLQDNYIKFLLDQQIIQKLNSTTVEQYLKLFQDYCEKTPLAQWIVSWKNIFEQQFNNLVTMIVSSIKVDKNKQTITKYLNTQIEVIRDKYFELIQQQQWLGIDDVNTQLARTFDDCVWNINYNAQILFCNQCDYFDKSIIEIYTKEKLRIICEQLVFEKSLYGLLMSDQNVKEIMSGAIFNELQARQQIYQTGQQKLEYILNQGLKNKLLKALKSSLTSIQELQIVVQILEYAYCYVPKKITQYNIPRQRQWELQNIWEEQVCSKFPDQINLLPTIMKDVLQEIIVPRCEWIKEVIQQINQIQSLALREKILKLFIICNIDQHIKENINLITTWIQSYLDHLKNRMRNIVKNELQCEAINVLQLQMEWEQLLTENITDIQQLCLPKNQMVEFLIGIFVQTQKHNIDNVFRMEIQRQLQTQLHQMQ